ncbi:MAG: metal ABC transporter ATP-binding protein [Patescibacteria group bacterium]
MPKSLLKIKNKDAIKVSNLTVSYDENIILDNLSFVIPKGCIGAIIGPNGSGKTTLIKAILDLIKIDKGEIKVLGTNVNEVRGKIGYVPQRFAFEKTFPITVREFFSLTMNEKCSQSHCEEKLKEVGLPIEIAHEQLGHLSGGQLQRVLIAQAILRNPEILMLDEPSTGIDILGEAAFYDIVDHLNQIHGTTILIVSHDIAMVFKSVQHVICINRKLMCVGPPRTALTPKKLDELFGESSHLYEHDHEKHHGHS